MLRSERRGSGWWWKRSRLAATLWILVMALGQPAAATERGPQPEALGAEQALRRYQVLAVEAIAQVQNRHQMLQDLPEAVRAEEQAGIAAHARERDQVIVLACALVLGAHRQDLGLTALALGPLHEGLAESRSLFLEVMGLMGDEEDLPPLIPL